MYDYVYTCAFMHVCFYTGIFFLPQNCKHEGTNAWDELTYLKNMDKMTECQITLITDSWNRVKLCIKTVTIDQLIPHNLFCCSKTETTF